MVSLRNDYTRAKEIEESAQELVQFLEEQVATATSVDGQDLTNQLRSFVQDTKESLLPLEQDAAQIRSYSRKVAYDSR